MMSKEERKEQKALLASWTAQLTNYLVEDCCMPRSEAFDSYEYKSAPDDNKLLHYGVFTYWDLDKEAFRSFSALRLIEIVEWNEEVREVKDK